MKKPLSVNEKFSREKYPIDYFEGSGVAVRVEKTKELFSPCKRGESEVEVRLTPLPEPLPELFDLRTGKEEMTDGFSLPAELTRAVLMQSESVQILFTSDQAM